MENQLKEIFESDEFLAQNINKFRKVAKEKIPGVTNKEIKDFYDKNFIKEIMTPFVSKKTFNPIVTLKANFVLYLDSLFYKQHDLAVIVAMDLFSKKAYGLAVKLKKKTKKKKGETVISGTSVKATDALQLLQKILNSDKYSEIRVDSGSEFQAQFGEYIRNTPGITVKYLTDPSKRLTSPIERFVRTFRGLFAKKKEIKNGRVYANRQKFVDEIIETYNNTVHSTIKDTPNNVYNNVNNAKRNVIKIYREKLKKSTPNQNILGVGTKVRHYIQKKVGGTTNIFQKTGQNWSKRVYTIQENTYNSELKRYRINGKDWPAEYLLVVTEASESKADPESKRRGRPKGPRKTGRRRNVPERLRD